MVLVIICKAIQIIFKLCYIKFSKTLLQLLLNKIKQSSDPDAEDGYIETVHVTPAIDPENVPQYFEHEYGLVIRSYKEN